LSKETKLPAIPHSSDPATKALKEALEVRLGRRGDPLDRALTIRDLYENGVLNVRGLPALTAGASNYLQPVTVTGDTSPPPAPTNLLAAGAFVGILVSWDSVTRKDLTAHIYRNTVDDRATAVFIGTTVGHIYSDLVGHDKTYYYWVRYVSTMEVTGPFNAVAGTLGVTDVAVSTIIAALGDAIGQTHLSTTLSEEINKIEPLTGLNETSATIATLLGQAQDGSAAVELLRDAIEIELDTVTVTWEGEDGDGGTKAQLTTSVGAVVLLEQGILADTFSQNVTWEGEDGDAGVKASLTSSITAVTTLKSGVIADTSSQNITWEGEDALGGVKASLTSSITAVTTLKEGVDANLDTQTISWEGSTGDGGVKASLTTSISEVTEFKDGINDVYDEKYLSWEGGIDLEGNAVEGIKNEIVTVENFFTNLSENLMSDITSFQATWGVGETVTSVFIEQGTVIDDLAAEQYVKIDAGGKIAGYGLYNDTVLSEFAINADVFKVSDGTTDIQPFIVVIGAGLAIGSDGTQYGDQTQAWQIENHPTGKWFAPGTYIESAMIADASIDVAKIHNLTVDFANITGLLTAAQLAAIEISAQAITSGFIDGARIDASLLNVADMFLSGTLDVNNSTGALAWGKTHGDDFTNTGLYFGKENGALKFNMGSTSSYMYFDGATIQMVNVQSVAVAPAALSQYQIAGTYSRVLVGADVGKTISIKILGGGGGGGSGHTSSSNGTSGGTTTVNIRQQSGALRYSYTASGGVGGIYGRWGGGTGAGEGYWNKNPYNTYASYGGPVNDYGGLGQPVNHGGIFVGTGGTTSKHNGGNASGNGAGGGGWGEYYDNRTAIPGLAGAYGSFSVVVASTTDYIEVIVGAGGAGSSYNYGEGSFKNSGDGVSGAAEINVA
jgi:hypothetical protein